MHHVIAFFCGEITPRILCQKGHRIDQTMKNDGFGSSIWSHGSEAAPLSTDLIPEDEVDVVIVGAGLLGLSSALQAARSGYKVRVIDAHRIAGGASGKNGGQVIPGLKFDPRWLINHYGPSRGERLVDFVSKTADKVFDLIQAESLNVPHRRSGWIYAAHTTKGMALASSRNQQWTERGADVRLLDGPEIAAITGAKGYLGGWLDRRAGVVDPLTLTREIARVAVAAGARLTENETISSLEPIGDRYRLRTASGHLIDARKVIIATNAYADSLVPGLAQSIVPLHSFQIATAPLPEDIAAEILPQGQAVSDSRRILVYYRKTPDGRLMLGGRGRSSEPTAEKHWAHLHRAMVRLFPALDTIDITHRWYGRIAMTPDYLPHVHEPYPGVVAALGCQGRGVGLMTALGPKLADYVLTGDENTMPFVITKVRPIPFHAFRKIGISAAITYYRALDAMER